MSTLEDDHGLHCLFLCVLQYGYISACLWLWDSDESHLYENFIIILFVAYFCQFMKRDTNILLILLLVTMIHLIVSIRNYLESSSPQCNRISCPYFLDNIRYYCSS